MGKKKAKATETSDNYRFMGCRFDLDNNRTARTIVAGPNIISGSVMIQNDGDVDVEIHIHDASGNWMNTGTVVPPREGIVWHFESPVRIQTGGGRAWGWFST